MQIGTPAPTQPIGHGATNAHGWVYGLFELAIVLGVVLLVTLPFWGKGLVDWLFRPFGSSKQDDNE
jgi:hypothetical protein